MASIVKRKKKYSVVYTYTDENGNKRQKWETFDTNAEAKKRKLQVEYEQESGTFIPPSAKTVNDLLEEYMSIYGVNTWAMSTYESRKSLIANYIRPLIGDMKLEDVSPRIMDKYYRDLLTVKAVSTKYVKARNEYLTPHTVREIHKVLRNAFNQAVKWELMTRNPVEHATLPKEEHKTRDIWTAEVLLKALEACDDDILRLAINLAFSCSLRMGELLGLTWDCVDISPASIELGQASIFVEKELQRVNREAMADLNGKDIMFKFPPTFASTHTALVLKTPKTKTSVRKLSIEVISAETNAELLTKIPHESMEDMAVVYRFVLESNDTGRASILVTNDMIDHMGVTHEQLKADALENAPEIRPAVIQGMSEVMREMMGPEAFEMFGLPEEQEEMMYVATVPDKNSGAGVLAYQDFMDQAAEKLGGDFYILPSSIHEILLVPDNGDKAADDLRDMVREVNATQVSPEEKLTDNVYHYDSKEHIFELAEKFEARQQEKAEAQIDEKSEEHGSVLKDLKDKQKEVAAKPPVKDAAEKAAKAKGGEAL